MIKRAASKLYNWVALMMVLGALLGHFFPPAGVALQPVADAFIGLIKMLIRASSSARSCSGLPGPAASRRRAA